MDGVFCAGCEEPRLGGFDDKRGVWLEDGRFSPGMCIACFW